MTRWSTMRSDSPTATVQIAITERQQIRRQHKTTGEYFAKPLLLTIMQILRIECRDVSDFIDHRRKCAADQCSPACSHFSARLPALWGLCYSGSAHSTAHNSAPAAGDPATIHQGNPRYQIETTNIIADFVAITADCEKRSSKRISLGCVGSGPLRWIGRQHR